MTQHPVPFDDSGGSSPRLIAKAKRAKESNDLAVYRYDLGAAARALMDQADSWAAHDANRTALECELDLLDYGLARTGGSAAKAELVARTVSRLSNINDRRITRRFGG
jgi:hypothetical protein